RFRTKLEAGAFPPAASRATFSPMTMRSMRLERPRTPLQPAETPVPEPGPGQVLIRVAACGVCRTDLHVVDGELTEAKLPIVPGHEIVGQVVRTGRGVDWFREGERVGIPWLGYT